MTVDEHGVIWAKASDVVAGDVLADGQAVLSVLHVNNAFVKITYEWGDVGQSMFPGVNQLVPLKSVNVE